jgi:hypothetical protein
VTRPPTKEEVDAALLDHRDAAPVPMAWIVDESELRAVFMRWATLPAVGLERYDLFKAAFCLGMGLGIDIGERRDLKGRPS